MRPTRKKKFFRFGCFAQNDKICTILSFLLHIYLSLSLFCFAFSFPLLYAMNVFFLSRLLLLLLLSVFSLFSRYPNIVHLNYNNFEFTTLPQSDTIPYGLYCMFCAHYKKWHHIESANIAASHMYYIGAHYWEIVFFFFDSPNKSNATHLLYIKQKRKRRTQQSSRGIRYTRTYNAIKPMRHQMKK